MASPPPPSSSLEDAEDAILSSLASATSALRVLSSASTEGALSFNAHAEAFVGSLASAQGIIRAHISALGPDLPLENASMRSLVEADVALESTAVVCAALGRCVAAAGRGTDAAAAGEAQKKAQEDAEEQLADVLGGIGGVGEGESKDAAAIGAEDLQMLDGDVGGDLIMDLG